MAKEIMLQMATDMDANHKKNLKVAVRQKLKGIDAISHSDQESKQIIGICQQSTRAITRRNNHTDIQ